MSAVGDNAKQHLQTLIAEYQMVLNTDGDGDEKTAHLGRIKDAGRVALSEYKAVAEEAMDKELLDRIPAIFYVKGNSPV